MASLEVRIKNLEGPGIHSVPLIVDGFGCKTIEEAQAKYEKEHGINPGKYRGGKVLYIMDEDVEKTVLN
ncbi:MAG: hypothetical protein ABSA44_03635 [Bacteroidota bacterium]